MGDADREVKKALLVKTAFFAGVMFVLCLGVFVFWVRSSSLSDELRKAAREKTALSEEKQRLNVAIAEKDKALDISAKQNFQEDLITVEAALKDTNQKLSAAIRDKATVENTSLILDSRLKNTTNELTKTLEDLKKTRETLSGIDGQYKIKFSQVADNLKVKEDQLNKLTQKLKDKEAALAAYQSQGKDYSELTRKYSRQAADFETKIAALNKTLAEKEKALAQNERLLKMAREEAARLPPSSGREEMGESSGKVAGLEKEKSDLERQISDASARTFDEREQLKDLEKKVAILTDTLSDRDKALSSKEEELDRYRREAAAMKKDIASLRSGSTNISDSSAVFSAQQEELEQRVHDLEKDKRNLETQLSRLQKGSSKSAAAVANVSSDPFLDRNFRLLTETLVKKEEQIKEMQSELDGLRQEKKTWEFGSGDRQKRLEELEVLVTTLTKQLGEYAGMIEKKDSELKVSAEKVAQLSDEVEAQKVAAIAIQKELAAARARQEKTFQTLTQVMGMNAGSSSAVATGLDTQKANAAAANDVTAAPENPPISTTESMGAAGDDSSSEASAGPTDSESVKKKVEELKRKVEVLLQSK